jgi:type IV secretion system protein VirB9
MSRILALCLTVLLSQADAAEPGRVELLPYDPTAVVVIYASVGYAVHIAIDPNEHIESAALGDSEHWEVRARDGTHDVFLKPRPGAGPTNLALRTDLRSYSFSLRLARSGSPTFRIEFSYPSKKPSSTPSPISTAYSMQIGPHSQRIAPIAAYDDDHYTYLTFPEHAERPAVFEVLDDGSERLLNHHSDGDVLVVHAVTRQLVLRLGSDVVSIFKDKALPDSVVPDYRTVNREPARDRPSSFGGKP